MSTNSLDMQPELDSDNYEQLMHWIRVAKVALYEAQTMMEQSIDFIRWDAVPNELIDARESIEEAICYLNRMSVVTPVE